MRLLFVHDRFGAMAGAEVNIHLTAAALQSRGHDIGLVHGPSTGKAVSTWNALFEQRYALEDPDPGTRVATALRQFRPDAIYVHKMSDLMVLEGLVTSGRPVARMVHDHDLYCLRSYKYFPLTRRICTRGAGLHCIFPCGGVLKTNRGGVLPFRWQSYRRKLKELQLNRRFERLVVATAYMRDELIRNRFASHRIEIHSPVPWSTGNEVQSSFSDQNLVLFSGQVIRGKGVDLLLRALAKVRAPFQCAIVGDGNHRAVCEALSRKLKLHDRVTFHGYLPFDKLAAFYSEACVVAVSSVWPEPFGAVGIEAMRHGVPVVGFDSGGIPEWLIDGENGFLIPWADTTAFAERIEQLLRDKPLARRLGAQGRNRALAESGFDHYVSGLEGMFDRIVSSRVALPA